MKIAYIGPALDRISGGYLYDRKLLEFLKTKEDEIVCFYLPVTSYFKQLIYGAFRTFLNPIKLCSGIDLILQDELSHLPLLFLNRKIRTFKGPPIISIIHHLRSDEEGSRIFKRICRQTETCYVNSLDGFIFNSQATRNNIRDLIRREPKGVVAHPGGNRLGEPLSRNAITRRTVTARKLNIIFVGNLIKRKGLEQLLDILAELAEYAWDFSVIGNMDFDASYSSFLVRKVKGLGISHKVHFCGPVNDEELRNKFIDSHILAMPFSYEGFGTVCLEAMSFGIPSLVNASGGTAELVKPGVNGYLYQSGNHKQVKETLERLLRRRDELLRLSLGARSRYDEFPLWNETVLTIRNFLLETCGGLNPA